MRKIVVAVMSTLSGLVLLFSYHTSTNSGAATTTTGTDSGSGTDPSASASTTPNAGGASSTTPSAGSSSSTGTDPSRSGSYTGDAVGTRWGTVQVRITVKDGSVISAEAVEYPTGNPKDRQINAYAIPQLNDEVVSAQSASIDAVSGATVTSDGYITSLQSAVDQANLK